MLYVGYGMVLAAVLTSTRRLAGPATPLFAFIGFYSYSIYLWHLPVLYVLRWLRLPPASAGIYFAGSLVVGVLVAKAVEIPTLRLRDWWFPATEMAPAMARSHALIPGAAGGFSGRPRWRSSPPVWRPLACSWRPRVASGWTRTATERGSAQTHTVTSSRRRAVPEKARTRPAASPGYPAIVRLLSGASGLRPVPAGRVVSAVATVGALFILALALPQAGPAQRTLVVLLAGVAPGFLWWHTTLPISSLACLSLAAVALANRGHFRLAAPAAPPPPSHTQPASSCFFRLRSLRRPLAAGNGPGRCLRPAASLWLASRPQLRSSAGRPGRGPRGPRHWRWASHRHGRRIRPGGRCSPSTWS